MFRSFRNLVYLFGVLFCLIACPQLFAQGSRLQEIIKALSFEPLNAKPVDFKIPDLNGQDFTLESLQGKWTFLTFWATWCGACMQELPELQRLHIAFGLKGLNVIGIATDTASTSEVARFIEGKKYNFVVLHDTTQQAASDYQANAIPLTYLISPNLRLAGVAKGAHVWTRPEQMKMIEELLSIKEMDVSDKDEGLSLGANLEAPAIKLVLPEVALKTNKKYELKVQISWQGDSSQYLIKVPTIKLPAEVEAGAVSSVSNSRMGVSSLEYVYPISAKHPGSYILGPVELAYRHRMGGQDLFTRLAEKEVTFEETGPSWALIVGGFIFLMTLAGVVFFFNQKNRRAAIQRLEAAQMQDQRAAYQREMQRLTRLKLDGHRREYAAGLVNLLMNLLPAKQDELKGVHAELAYSGIDPSDAQLRVYERELESLLQK